MTKSIIYYTDNRLGEPIFSAVQRKLLQSDRKSTRLNSSHSQISYAVFCLKKKKDAECFAVLLYRDSAEGGSQVQFVDIRGTVVRGARLGYESGPLHSIASPCGAGDTCMV